MPNDTPTDQSCTCTRWQACPPCLARDVEAGRSFIASCNRPARQSYRSAVRSALGETPAPIADERDAERLRGDDEIEQDRLPKPTPSLSFPFGVRL